MDELKDAGYYMEHPEEFEALSEQDQNLFMFGGQPQGETKSETSPDLTDKEEVEPEKVEEDTKDQPVVQAKDGKHTIPYSELEAARKKVERLEQAATEQAALIEDLKAAQAKDEETGGTEAQDAVMADYAGEYPELMEDIKPFLAQMMAGEVKKQVDAFKAEINKDLQPLKDKEEESAVTGHFSLIAEKHPDYKEVAASDALHGWVNAKPSVVRAAYDQVLNNGTAEEVVSVLDEFRKDHPTAVIQPKGDMTKKAEDIIAGIKPVIPSSMSDIPGATAAHHDEAEAMLEMGGLSLVNKFLTMSPDKIEESLSRLL